jgi:hypothetical protein
MKTIPVSGASSLEVSNKYGTIEISQWRKDSVMIRAEIKAFAPSREKLEKMFEGVSVNINDSKLNIRAETSFTQNINMLFENFKGMTSKLISYDSRVEINYYISVPSYLNMRIDNKYGDVYMENNSGNLTVSVSNGSFKAGALGKGVDLTLTFCDATISSVESGRIDANFSEISADQAGDLNINSISSKYELKKAGMISIESRRDKFYIDNISTIKGSSYFTDFNLRNLKREISLTTRYGNFRADMIDRGFESVNLNTGYSDVDLTFEENSSYNLDVRHLNAFVVISEKNSRIEKKVINDDKKEYVSSGVVGKNPGSAKVNIDATHGDIYIK